jgi:hypothetical protein
MANQFGRISGPLLADNLKRNGVDLAFDTSLLYLNVNSGNTNIGINNNTPVAALHVGTFTNQGGTTTGNINTINLIGTGTSDLANFEISGSTINNIITGLTIQPNQSTNPLIVTSGVSTSDLLLTSNAIRGNGTNSDINFNPSGTGSTVINNSVLINGSLHATGNITFDGDLQLGNDPSDLITILAEVNSDIVPAPTDFVGLEVTGDQWITEDGLAVYDESGITAYNLGSGSLQWKNLYANNLIGGGLTGTMNVSQLALSTMQAGNVYFNNDTISNVNSSNNVVFSVSGTGKINMPNSGITIKDSTLTTTPGTPLTLASTGTGYWKIAGSKAWVVAAGTTTQRPPNPEVGTFRWNTDNRAVEVYSDPVNTWVGITGTSPILSQEAVYDTADAWALILA